MVQTIKKGLMTDKAAALQRSKAGAVGVTRHPLSGRETSGMLTRVPFSPLVQRSGRAALKIPDISRRPAGHKQTACASVGTGQSLSVCLSVCLRGEIIVIFIITTMMTMMSFLVQRKEERSSSAGKSQRLQSFAVFPS